MQTGRIDGETRNLGAPKDRDKDKNGRCLGLPIRDENIDGLPAMKSAWFPLPDELERLNAGAPVYLTVVGTGHPPVALTVGQIMVDSASTKT